MNEQYAKLLEQLALKLGTTSNYLWNVLVSQGKIDAIYSSIIIVVTMLYIGILFTTRKKLKDRINDDEVYNFAMVIISAVGIIFIIWSLVSLSTVVKGFFNPEYYALEKLISLIK